MAVVSFSGKSWISFNPIFLDQSTKYFKSENSPIPALWFERNEKTGIATPVPFHCVFDNCANPSLTITAQAERAFSMWPNKGEADPRPAQNSPYKRIDPVMPNQPFVPKGAVGELRVS